MWNFGDDFNHFPCMCACVRACVCENVSKILNFTRIAVNRLILVKVDKVDKAFERTGHVLLGIALWPSRFLLHMTYIWYFVVAAANFDMQSHKCGADIGIIRKCYGKIA